MTDDRKKYIEENINEPGTIRRLVFLLEIDSWIDVICTARDTAS
jgi:hypothetical protein